VRSNFPSAATAQARLRRERCAGAE